MDIYSQIKGTGSYLPEKVVTNTDLEKKVDTSDEWIVQRTGIEKRHIASDSETVVSMGTLAAKNAIESAGLSPEDIDGVIVATSTASQIFPSTACSIQRELNIPNCLAFDIQAACAGFVYILGVANSLIQTGAVKNVLLIGSEIMSRVLNWEDRSTCVLFGDGAGAIVLGASEEVGVYSTLLNANGRFSDLLNINNLQTISSKEDKNPYLTMQGGRLFKQVVKVLEEVSLEIIQRNNLKLENIDWLIPHQANIRIIQGLAKKLKLEDNKIITLLNKHANTAAASIPLALDYGVKQEKIKKGQNILLEAIGGGLTWGAALIKY